MPMDDEIRMLQLDKPGQGKSNTEIQKHSIDDYVFENKPLDRAMYILSKGDELQKLSVIGSLPELLKYDQKGTVSKIIPKIQQELPNSSSEFNLAVSRMFTILIQMDIPVNLIPQVIQGIENRDPIIANAWMETLLAVIPLLKENFIKNDVLKCAISKSQLSKSAYFRVSSCKILGRISVHKTMNPFEVKKDVLPLVQSLCQDCFHEVRGAMCKELPYVAKGLFNLGDAIVKVNLLPLLVELSADEQVEVRSIAIESVVAIIPFLNTDTVKGTIIPLAKKLCTKSALEVDTTYTAIAASFTMLINNLQPQMSPNDAMWFLDYFSHICKKGLSLVEDIDTDPSVSMLCRENCANCLPRVAVMLQALIPAEVAGKWYNAFKALAADPCYLVRKAVANCFAEVVRILESNNKLVVIDFTKLLRDEDDEVLQALIPNISNILESFLMTGVLQREATVQATLDIGRAMLKCQIESFRTNNWRMKDSLLKQWERLPNCFPSDFIHQHFSPIILNATVYGKAKPVRSQATRTLLLILKYSVKENHRKWIREQILMQLCYSKCCYSRQVYITLCVHALDIFSWKYFKDYFYQPLLSLAEDQISIVRLTMVKLCPVMKQMLVLPVDKALQLKLETILSKMEMMESDHDVIMMLKSKLKEMRTFRTVKIDVLVEDRRKEEEENKILKGKMSWAIQPSQVQGQAGTSHSGHKADNISEAGNSQSSVLFPKAGSPKQTLSTKRLSDGSSSPMPFLDQHFYTDAGVSLPQDFTGPSHRDRDLKSPLKTSMEVTKLIESAESLTSWLDEINISDGPSSFQEDSDSSQIINLEEKDIVISMENVNPAETLTENDVKALETTTTNMTDELKANIQGILEPSSLKPRSKRNSCVFRSEIRPPSNLRPAASLKRRSLNIPNSDISRIPVSRGNRLSYHEKSKSVSDQALDISSNSGKSISRLSRLTRSAVNLRENSTGSSKSLPSSRSSSSSGYEALSGSDDSKVERNRLATNDNHKDASRIPYITHHNSSKYNKEFDANDRKDYITDNIKRFTASPNFYRPSTSYRVNTVSNKPLSFRRYSASDKTFKESLRETIKNNNLSTNNSAIGQGDESPGSSNYSSAKLVDGSDKHSGLPLSVRRKNPPK